MAMPSTTEPAPEPTDECDVILQGGTASGVIYPRALSALAARYRLRGIGGTSAGAMAAAVAAAAEYGRRTGRGGFAAFETIPEELGRGGLRRLFQPTGATGTLLDVLLAATGGDRPDGRTGAGRIGGVLAAAVRGYPWFALAGALPGLVLIVLGVVVAGPWAIVFGAFLVALLGPVALIIALMINLSRDLPENSFGMCTGLSSGGAAPALTEWLQTKINLAAGLDADAPPLTFGQLWTAGQVPDNQDDHEADDLAAAALADPRRRSIDLRMTTTCISQARPYELPFSARGFFYDPDEWRRIFPAEVMAALQAIPEPRTPEADDPQAWASDRDQAAAHSPGLRRLPDAELLPVIVAARMSLSIPLVISAVPLWMIERSDSGPDGRLDPTGPRRFVKVWFSDGGLSNNFPLQIFDGALPTRPTYAINLQSFPPGVKPAGDEAENVEWAHGNADGLAPRIASWPGRGLGAVLGFLSAIYTSSSSWQDTTQLTFPGFRDRIVRVLQTEREGGINLAMSDETIQRLAERGEFAAKMIMGQFTEPHYPPKVDGRPTGSGWTNHQWVRYRALLSVLPAWAASYGRGRALMERAILDNPPSYPFRSKAERQLAEDLDTAMQQLAQVVADADPKAVSALTSRPWPVGAIRRVPQL